MAFVIPSKQMLTKYLQPQFHQQQQDEMRILTLQMLSALGQINPIYILSNYI